MTFYSEELKTSPSVLLPIVLGWWQISLVFVFFRPCLSRNSSRSFQHIFNTIQFTPCDTKDMQRTEFKKRTCQTTRKTKETQELKREHVFDETQLFWLTKEKSNKEQSKPATRKKKECFSLIQKQASVAVNNRWSCIFKMHLFIRKKKKGKTRHPLFLFFRRSCTSKQHLNVKGGKTKSRSRPLKALISFIYFPLQLHTQHRYK